MPFRFSELVGCYRLVVSDALLAFIERAFVEAAPEAEKENVRLEALREAELAELEIQADGVVISRAGNQEWYRSTLAVTDEQVDAVRFEKSPGQLVTLRLRDAETLVASQPNKPDALFRVTRNVRFEHGLDEPCAFRPEEL